MMRLLRPSAALSLLRSRTGLAIALCCPCSAQALGDHPWSPVRRMRRTLASRATHALHPHSGIFSRSFRLHSTYYAKRIDRKNLLAVVRSRDGDH